MLKARNILGAGWELPSGCPITESVDPLQGTQTPKGKQALEEEIVGAA